MPIPSPSCNVTYAEDNHDGGPTKNISKPIPTGGLLRVTVRLPDIGFRALIHCLPSTTLSIGSGSGLLESLILHDHPNLGLFGVEVSTQVNKYLSRDRLHVVKGTWDLDDAAGSAEAWLFVYPREPYLLQTYLDEYGRGAVRKIIWLGPRADLKEYENIVESYQADWTKEGVEDCGLVPYETLIVWTRSN